MSATYDAAAIESVWQKRWEEGGAFRAANPPEPGSEKPKYYVLDFFPYPSGAGLHVGHPRGYIASDIIARHMRMRGYNVLHPMGWDAFGLPAEQYAIETGVHPAITTQKNIETYRRQLKQIGLSYDWSREIATCTPDYYHWTQWIFQQIFDAWYDPDYEWVDGAGRKIRGRARPISELPIPPEVAGRGPRAIEDFQNEHRLAYLAEVPVNWCPALGTVLANEEVTADGRSERGNHPVFRRPMKQWMLRITEYAERLLSDLEPLNWPEPIKLMQRNWIGRSEGAYVDFRIADDTNRVIRVYTTRPDTLFGATYLVLAPEHRLVSSLTAPEQHAAVQAYVAQAANRSDLERTSDSKKKTGVFTGAYAINPVNGAKVPIWVADYVLASYGTGSIMAVPGHDTRDLEFAETFGLPVIQVVQPPDGQDWRGFVGDGVAVNSPAPDTACPAPGCSINGLPTPEAKKKIVGWLESQGLGEGTVQYKLRDWLFSRQRYWGEPFPVAYTPDGSIRKIPESELPVRLPDLDDFRPHASDDPDAEPQTPLSRAGAWQHVMIDGVECRRELNTMPNWAGSCWYYLRFIDPKRSDAFAGRDAERYWMTSPAQTAASSAVFGDAATVAMGSAAAAAGGSIGGPPAAPGEVGVLPAPAIGGVDLYIGGAEHAVLHLLYARFWHKLLFDLGHVSTPEPFQQLFNQGMIQAAAYKDERGVYVEASQVVDANGAPAIEHQDSPGPFFYQGRPVTREFGKMGKSLKNVVNPDAIIAEYGADTLRLYEMYIGPLESHKPWNTRDMVGMHRFLQRVWRLVVEQVGGEESAEWRLSLKLSDADEPELERLLHKTIKKVTEDFGRFAFNTAIAQLIVWSNEAQRAASVGRSQVERFLRLLAPMAPHICEELWQRLGGQGFIAHAAWPTYDEALTRDATVEIAVQVGGKVRARIHVPADADEAAAVSAAQADESVQKFLAGKTVRKTIYVPKRLVNFIV
jgi:leucyl-tRNA synthetase